VKQAIAAASPVKCKGCGNCDDKTFCKPWRGDIGDYGISGIRYTADGFDCAFPVSIDTYNQCSFHCMYCFSNYLMRDPYRKGNLEVRALTPSRLETYLRGETTGMPISVLEKIAKDKGYGFNCPVQWGALGDPFDCIERQHGLAPGLMKVFRKYDQPVRISTKGGSLLLDESYLAAFAERPELFWVAFSIISIDDEVLERVDKFAPNATVRLKAMKALSKLGVKTSLRLRPILPGITDATPKHPKAWKELLQRARDSGARSLSMEFSFVPGMRPPHVKAMWEKINGMCGFNVVDWYKRTTSVRGQCLRSSRAWKEDLTFAIYEEAKNLGYHFGISDPHWKELNDFGNCCGIPPTDKYFGGWCRQNATNAIVEARDTGCKVSAMKYIPEFAWKTRMERLICMSGAHNAFRRATYTWGDKLRDTWNDVGGPRGPLNYFEGCLKPVKVLDNGDVQYKYEKVARRKGGVKAPFWVINK
jgi:DNA repair photolyase